MFDRVSIDAPIVTALLVTGVIIGMLFGVIIESSNWKESIIKRDLAYYHPVTREFTWKEFKDVKWEKVEK